MQAKAKRTLFDLLNDICFTKVKWKDQSDSDQKLFQPFMINRWLSMHLDYIDLVAECQPQTTNLSSEQLYNFYLDILPKSKFFTKYISAKSEKKNTKIIEFLSDKLEVSRSEMEDYLDILDIAIVRDEIKKYGYDDKTLKKEFSI